MPPIIQLTDEEAVLVKAFYAAIDNQIAGFTAGMRTSKNLFVQHVLDSRKQDNNHVSTATDATGQSATDQAPRGHNDSSGSDEHGTTDSAASD